MKKNKLLVILSLVVTLSCLFSALSMNAFAGMLENDYYVTNREYTSATRTSGYSSASFTGNYYGFDDSRNDAILACEAYGGPRSEFITDLSIDFQGEDFVYLDSETENHRMLNASVESSTVQIGDYACSLQSCYPHPPEQDDTEEDNTEDFWDRFYYAEWAGFPYGWANYLQDPE